MLTTKDKQIGLWHERLNYVGAKVGDKAFDGTHLKHRSHSQRRNLGDLHFRIAVAISK